MLFSNKKQKLRKLVNKCNPLINNQMTPVDMLKRIEKVEEYYSLIQPLEQVKRLCVDMIKEQYQHTA